MVDVRGKWALVTGASRGIGYLAAKCLAERGCNLILHSRSMEHTEKILSEVKAMGVQAHAVSAELDRCLVNSEVAYEAPFDVNDSFAEIFSAFADAQSEA